MARRRKTPLERIYGPPYPRLIEMMLAYIGLWIVLTVPSVIRLAGDGAIARWTETPYTLWSHWLEVLGSPVTRPWGLFGEMGLWVFGPVVDSPFALPLSILAGLLLLTTGRTWSVRLFAALWLAAGAFGLAWIDFGSSGAVKDRLPVFVEPVVGACAAAVVAGRILAIYRASPVRKPLEPLLPGLTLVALAGTSLLVASAGPVGAFAYFVEGDLETLYEKSGALMPPGNGDAISVVTALLGLPVLFLTVVISVRRLPLGESARRILRTLRARPGEYVVGVAALSLVASLLFLVGTRVIWGEILAERTSDAALYVGVMLTVFTGAIMGAYVYFAVRTVMVLTEE
jgi:hypothetical protein